MPYFISEKKADSVSISVQCCTPTFRKSYFYLPVYPFSEQFFLLLFTDLIIIFCFQPVKDFCSTRSDTLCKTAQGLHEKCRINTQIDTPGSQKQSPWCFPDSFGKPFGLQRKDQRKKKRQKIPSLHAQVSQHAAHQGDTGEHRHQLLPTKAPLLREPLDFTQIVRTEFGRFQGFRIRENA